MPHGPCKTADQVCGYLQSNSIGYTPFLNPRMTAPSIRSASSISALRGHSSTYSRDPRAWVGGLRICPLELDFPDCYCLARCHHFTIVELASDKPHTGQRRESVARRDHLACTISLRNSFKCTEKTGENFGRAKLNMNVLGFLQTRPGPRIHFQRTIAIRRDYQRSGYSDEALPGYFSGLQPKAFRETIFKMHGQTSEC
ncbi:hypothetical protein BC567DRAFT_215660 [Phyllosticta citribraziliensis]